jgi:translin
LTDPDARDDLAALGALGEFATDDRGGLADLAALGALAADELAAAHRAREIALRACRAAIQACGRSIRATHRHEDAIGAALAGAAREELDEARRALTDFPVIAAAGFLHDAEKEYAEAVLFATLATRAPLPGHVEVRVAPAAWFNGLAEAASELRRHTLDTLRTGDLARAQELFAAMDDVYGLLVTVDLPDAVTGGLRRTTDALRAVLERTRSDLTTTVLQARLQASIDAALAATDHVPR